MFYVHMSEGGARSEGRGIWDDGEKVSWSGGARRREEERDGRTERRGWRVARGWMRRQGEGKRDEDEGGRREDERRRSGAGESSRKEGSGG